MMGFLSDAWDPLDLVEDEKKRKQKAAAEAAAKAAPESVGQVEGYDPQNKETKKSLLGGYLDKPVAPWEKEKSEQGTGEYWVKNLLGINSLFSPLAKKTHAAESVAYNSAMREAAAEDAERKRLLGELETFNTGFTDGDTGNDAMTYMTGRIGGLDADDLATAYYDDPMFEVARNASSSREVLFQPKYRQREDGRYEAVQYSNMPGAEPQVRLMEEGFLPESALMDPDTVNKYISDFGDQKQARAGELRASSEAIRRINAIPDEDWTAGLAGKIEGFGKEIFGEEDPESWAKRAASQVAQIEALKLLPPGPATDRDVSIVLDKVPGKDANKETWIDYLTAVQKIQQSAYLYAKEKGDYIGRNGRRGFAGFEKHWDSIYGKDGYGHNIPVGESNAFDEEGQINTNQDDGFEVPEQFREAFQKWLEEQQGK